MAAQKLDDMSAPTFHGNIHIFVSVSLSQEHMAGPQKNPTFSYFSVFSQPLAGEGVCRSMPNSLVGFSMSWIHGAFKRHHEINSERVMEMPTEQITCADYLAAKGEIKVTCLCPTM